MSAKPDEPAKPSGPAYLEPYRSAIEAVGPRFEALLWKSAESQTARFHAMTELIEPTGRVIADLGSGRGDYLAFLHDQGVEYGRYIGVEALDALREFSETRAREDNLPDAEFIAGDFIADESLFDRLVRDHGAETLVFSGSLNTLTTSEVETVIDRAWGAVQRVQGGALAFNFLSDRDGDRKPANQEDLGPAKRVDLLRLVAFALERTNRILVRSDYLEGHDATILMLAPA